MAEPREYRWVDPLTTSTPEAIQKLREHLYLTCKKVRETERDILYMEELLSVVLMHGV